MTRTAQISRATGETDIRVALALDGSGQGTRTTGVGFFDHMLDAVARHGGLDLDVEARGDLETGSHHTVEDVGIAIGQALDQALGDRSGITRFGSAVVPMELASFTTASRRVSKRDTAIANVKAIISASSPTIAFSRMRMFSPPQALPRIPSCHPSSTAAQTTAMLLREIVRRE